MDVVEHKEFDQEVTKAVAMKFVKQLGEGFKLEDVVRSRGDHEIGGGHGDGGRQ